MAQHKSAEKRARQTLRRTAVNRARRTRLRSAVKDVELAIAAGDKKAAAQALKLATPELDRGAGSGIVKKRTASRKVSRLVAGVKAMT